MLRQRLIPSLLLRDGRLVKGVGFKAHRDAGLPHTTARAHNHQGADELLLLDIDASRGARGPSLDPIRKVARECFMPLIVGGGIRSPADALACMDAGADKVCINTPALDDLSIVTDLARLLGSQAVVVSIDIIEKDSKPRVFDHRAGKTLDLDPFQWAARAVQNGAGEIRIMAVTNEGTRNGYRSDWLRSMKQAVSVPVIIEGGAGSLEHLRDALNADADGICVGSMLVFSDYNLVKIKRYLVSQHCNMRR